MTVPDPRKGKKRVPEGDLSRVFAAQGILLVDMEGQFEREVSTIVYW
jgi:hypothetical protein